MGPLIGSWIQQSVIIPDGLRKGHPYLLTGEMWRHLLWTFRLRDDADPDMGNGAYLFYGAQLKRVQKWGKDPFGAAWAIAQAFAPVLFAGWDDDGEPMGRPVPTPWIQIIATSEAQTVNTWRPLYTMLREGPLRDMPGLDIGETRVKLPAGDGWLEPVTLSMKSRLGAPITAATITEPHLMTETDGGVDTVRAVKRNLAGMDGRWLEMTNSWDPSQKSVAQRTAEGAKTRPGVYLDHRPPMVPLSDDEIADDETLYRRIRYVYGDSCRVAGGWVREERIAEDVRAEDTGDAERRRYFLDEIVVGSASAVDPTVWDALARTDDPLRPGDAIALGFDGSRKRDATTLVACRLRDMRLFHLRTWEPPPLTAEEQQQPGPGEAAGGWRVPKGEVDQAVTDAFAAYDGFYLYGDPHRWQDYMESWSGKWPKKIVEFDTRSEKLMDEAIERVLTGLADRSLTHDGHETLSRHAKNAALANGKLKPVREPGKSEYYQRVVKKKPGELIDVFVAAILARAAAARAIEDGALNLEKPNPPATASTPPAGDDRGFWRPSKRLDLGRRTT